MASGMKDYLGKAAAGPKGDSAEKPSTARRLKAPSASSALMLGLMGKEEYIKTIAALEKRLAETQSATEIALGLIDDNPYQPRLQIHASELDELASSIEANGLAQPIVLRPHPKKPGHYLLVAGDRRRKAFEKLGKSEIPAYIVDIDDVKAAVLSLTENVARSNMTAYESYLGMKRLLDMGAAKTHEDLAKIVGLARSSVSQIFAFDRFPKDAAALMDKAPGLLGFSTASTLTALPESSRSFIAQGLQEMLDGNLQTEKALLDFVSKKAAEEASRIAPPPSRSQTKIKGDKGAVLFTLTENNNRLIVVPGRTLPPEKVHEAREKIAEILEIVSGGKKSS